jgi:threonine dehydrogenase-like Zn-dependent dehydrogenase
MKALIKPINNQLILSDIPDPSLDFDHTSEVLIKVNTVGLCRTDLAVASGLIKVEQDIIIGHEFSGLIIDGKKEYIGKKVAVNPLFQPNYFMGLNFNGCLAEKIVVPLTQVIIADGIDDKVAAYVEPVAASMAILNINLTGKGAIYGKNRIAQLTYIIAQHAHLDVDWLDEKSLPNSLNEYENYYDFIIETHSSEMDIENMIKMLKPNGKLIIKSRKKQSVPINFSDLVGKNLTLQAVNYYNFEDAMNWLKNNSSLIMHLLGNSYHIDQWQLAFNEATVSESNKIFIHF